MESKTYLKRTIFIASFVVALLTPAFFAFAAISNPTITASATYNSSTKKVMVSVQGGLSREVSRINCGGEEPAGGTPVTTPLGFQTIPQNTVHIISPGPLAGNTIAVTVDVGEDGFCGYGGKHTTFSGSKEFNVSSLAPGTYTIWTEVRDDYGLKGSKETTFIVPVTDCSDGVDNDGDGKVDLNDPGCSGPNDDDESNTWRVLTVNKAGTGSGTVTGPNGRQGNGINCGSNCVEDYNNNTSVTLTESPAAGSVFAGWSGACSGSNTTTSVTMSANKTCTATFNLLYTLTVTKTGSGTVTSAPAGISCGADCSEPYGSGTSVTLSAVPDNGYQFDNWSGSCSGTATSASVTMNANKTCTANFSAVPPPPPLECTVTITSNEATTWTLTGPTPKTESSPISSKTYTNMSVGTYTLAAGALAGFTGPSYSPSSSQTCVGGDTISYTVTYTPIAAPTTQCSDGIDNADPEDTLADTADPGCHTDGDAGNAASYDPNDDDETDGAVPPTPECSDGVDNTDIEDTLADAADNGCWTNPSDSGTYNPADNDERFVFPACSDGSDNDGDGLTDTNDPGCHTDGNAGNPGSYNPNGNDETDQGPAACADGEDNDNDGFIDYPADPECSSVSDDTESDDPTFEEF